MSASFAEYSTFPVQVASTAIHLSLAVIVEGFLVIGVLSINRQNWQVTSTSVVHRMHWRPTPYSLGIVDLVRRTSNPAEVLSAVIFIVVIYGLYSSRNPLSAPSIPADPSPHWLRSAGGWASSWYPKTFCVGVWYCRSRWPSHQSSIALSYDPVSVHLLSVFLNLSLSTLFQARGRIFVSDCVFWKPVVGESHPIDSIHQWSPVFRLTHRQWCLLIYRHPLLNLAEDLSIDFSDQCIASPSRVRFIQFQW